MNDETKEILNIHLRNTLLGIFFIVLGLVVFANVARADTIYSQTGAGGECCVVNGATGTDEAWSQTFTTAQDYDLTSADLWASSQGGSDGLRIVIYAVNNGFPTGTALFTSSTGTGWSTGSLNSQTVTFSNACLSAGSYTFVIERTGARDVTNNWVVGAIAGSGMAVSNSGSWAQYSSNTKSMRSALYGTPTTCSGGGGGSSDLTGTSTTAIATTTEDIMYIGVTALLYFFGISLMLAGVILAVNLWSTLRT